MALYTCTHMIRNKCLVYMYYRMYIQSCKIYRDSRYHAQRMYPMPMFFFKKKLIPGKAYI